MAVRFSGTAKTGRPFVELMFLEDGKWHDDYMKYGLYRGADKSLARPTTRCILFDGENISFDASLVLYI